MHENEPEEAHAKVLVIVGGQRRWAGTLHSTPGAQHRGYHVLGPVEITETAEAAERSSCFSSTVQRVH